MSGAPAVSVSGLGKRYRIGELQGGYELLTEKLSERLRRRGRAESKSDHWALRDIELEIPPGETFGVIGHNGAGKSTLLKVLSRVTPPTEGTIELRGRVGALLEVGAGFHPELTGRENIFLNGAVLGMSKREIAQKLDEIVAFAEVERFIETPVKRYSSGMYLRLAFSVAAHLEPEILIVDEVLSVGDLAFQRKCLGRMGTVAGEGRTVIFVSHNLAAVSNLCDRLLLLSGGRRVTEGKTEDVIAEYVKLTSTEAATHLADRNDRRGNGRLRFTEVRIEVDGETVDTPASGQDVEFVLSYETRDNRPLRNVNFAVQIMTIRGELLLHLFTHSAGATFDSIPASGEVRCRVPHFPLPAGQYGVTLWSDIARDPIDWVERAFDLTVHEGDFYGSGQAPPTSHQAVMVQHGWSVGESPTVLSQAPAGEKV